MKKSITASELSLFLNAANQEIGKLATENSYNAKEISRLGIEIHKAYSDIADLEHELELRDAIVRNLFGFELNRMISSGQNTFSTDMALRIIKLGMKNKILDIVSNLSNDIIVNYEMYSEFMRGLLI